MLLTIPSINEENLSIKCWEQTFHQNCHFDFYSRMETGTSIQAPGRGKVGVDL